MLLMHSAQWHTTPLPYDSVRKLTQGLGVSEVLASVLVRRGYYEPEAASRFLSPMGELYDPFLFPEMDRICALIRAAVASGKKICVHGDYDVDGITSTALLVTVLEELRAAVSFHLPNRFREGYGIATATVEKIAADGCELLITVDCGISAREQLARATELGMESIVIDHHLPAEEKIPAAMIISPLLCDYPFKELAGVGLAFKVAQGLLAGPGPTGRDDSLPPSLQKLLDLVALGTIADCVPLLDENRNLVKRGLVQLARTHRPGLIHLMRVGQVEPSRINAGMVAFRLAPRINAAGRMEDPVPALELLIADNEQEAERLAGELDSFNRERQRIENQMVAEAEAMINSWPETQKAQRGYVLSSKGWHEGVIGIVASRLVEFHNRPVIIIAEDEDQGLGKGSGRSVPGVDLHQLLRNMGHLLEKYGGHSAACGLTIDLENIQDFQNGFAEQADSVMADKELRQTRHVDALVCGQEMTLDLADELSSMEPFGLGNPSVELLATGTNISAARVTRDGRHLQCMVEAGGARSSAIGFGQAFLLEKLKPAGQWDVAFRLERNEFNGSVAPQLILREIFPRSGHNDIPAGMCDCLCDYECPQRMAGDDLWSLLAEKNVLPVSWNHETGIKQDNLEALGKQLEGRLIDRRGLGDIPGQVAKLVSGGQNVILLVSDVARRRHLLSQDLPVANSAIEHLLLMSSRCSQDAIKERSLLAAEAGQTISMMDFITVSSNPGILACHDHLVFIDPPPGKSSFASMIAEAPDAWIHLFYCADEVQFTGKVLEHEYDLRAPLTKVYKHLKAGKTWPLDETTERLLLAGGKYLRQPMLVVRCLRVLEELALISIEKNSGKPMLTLLEPGKTSLERSSTYNQVQAFYEGCLKFLSKSLSEKVI